MTQAAGHHQRLQRQIAQARAPSGEIDLEALLAAVSEAYDAQDEARRTHEQAAQALSSELLAVNEQLRDEGVALAGAAARLQGLFDSASEAILVVDDARIIRDLNNAALDLFGQTLEGAIGRPAEVLVARWPEGMFEAEVGEAPVEVLGRHASGRTFEAEVSVTRLKVDGQVQYMGFWRDVSARKASEAALVAMRDQAEAANRAKSEFLATMSHELRTPLNGVLGMAAALAVTPLNAHQSRMLRVLMDSGQGLMTLLSDLLDLSKIEAGKMSFESIPFDLAGSVETVAQLFAETATAKGLDYSIEVAPEAEGWFEGDPTRFRQVVQNLVSNAIKFTESGEVRIVVKAARPKAGRQRLEISVVDTGIGVPRKDAERLFEKFSQADSTTTRRFGGTGLGLAICRELVEGMGGEIGLSSKPGRGSRFWFRLTLACVAAQGGAASRTGGAAPAPRLRVLAAEDHPTNRMVLGSILALTEAEITFVEDGLSAVEAARTQDFDLVLMDLQMPVMDGLGATRAIRALEGPRSGVPILALTADVMAEQVAACRAAGMDGHVEKPLRPQSLFAAIEAVLAPAEAPPAVAVG